MASETKLFEFEGGFGTNQDISYSNFDSSPVGRHEKKSVKFVDDTNFGKRKGSAESQKNSNKTSGSYFTTSDRES